MPEHPPSPVAIVGMACVFPGAPSLDRYWENVVGGVDAITDVPPGRWDPVFAATGADAELARTGERFTCGRGGFVDDLATFDPTEFGIMPVVVEGAEPDQLLALATAARALADAGDPHQRVAPERVGVLLGRGGYRTAGVARLDQRVHVAQQLVEALRALLPDLGAGELEAVRAEFQQRLGPSRPEAAIGLVPNLAASRIANRLDLRGPAYTVDAACASSLLAVDQAVTELDSGRCDVVLAGGVHHCHDLTLWSVFTQLGALSPSGAIRPYAAGADGILVGEGTGVVVLKRLADADRDGDRVYAVIRGTGVASDGRDTSLMSPGVEGQVTAVEQAWRRAGLDPGTVGLVEGHGTATAAGDEVELETLRRAFGKEGDGRATAVLGSVKSMIGHAMPAAGVAGLIKAALAVHHGVLPPTLHVDVPHPRLADTRFRLVDRSEPWEGDGPRRAGVNAFGFGGINAHVVLDAPAPPAAVLPVARPGRSDTVPGSVPDRPDRVAGPLVLLAGRDAASLRDALDAWEAGRPPLAPDAGPARLAILAPNERRLTLARRVLERGEPWRGRNDVWFEPEGLLASGGRLAFLFPGVEPTFEPLVDDVAAHFGRPCDWRRETGPALERQALGLIAVGRLLHAVLGDLDVRPDAVAGHSLGEWCGELAAGIVSDEVLDGFIARMRPGAIEVSDLVFLALGCGADTAAELIAGLPDTVVSHDNCPHQSIVCGPAEHVAVAAERARARQVLGQELPFRSGFHSPMFTPHLAAVRRELGDLPLQVASTPLWSATTVAPYPDDPEAIRELATRHLVEPVRFRELTLRLHDEGVRVFVQLGVGSLAGFVDDTLRDRPHLALAAGSARAPGLEQLTRTAAALWVEGAPVALDRLPVDRQGQPGAVAPGGGARREGAGPAGPGGRPLDLGVRLVRDLTPLSRPPAARAAPAAPDGVPADHPLVAAVASVTDDALSAASLVLDRWAARPAPPPPLARTAGLAPQPTPPAAVPAPAVAGGPPTGPGGDPIERRTTLSLDVEPRWADHAFFRQAPDWPVPEDRFPLVPMTGILEMLEELAEETDPERVATAIEDVRALRWLRVDPPVEVLLRAQPEPVAADGTRRVRVAIEGHARATVVLAPAHRPAPAADGFALAAERTPSVTGDRVYPERWMFHGEAYQGIREVCRVGDDGIVGILECRPAPGALLDNAGQLIGIWMGEVVDHDRLALPVSIERIELFGPHPAPGERLECRVRVRELAPLAIRCDLELVRSGEVWCRITDWNDRRFATDARVFEMLRWPERRLVAEPRPGGYVVAHETWPDAASRDLMMRRYLTGDEQAAYEGHHPNGQRQFLLGRIAAKDATRHRLWSEGHGDLFPAEVEVVNEPSGRPRLRHPGAADLRVSLAHTTGVGVALVADGVDVGIDIEPVAPRSPRFADLTLTAAEQALAPPPALAGSPDLWLTALWTVKEAAAKAAGTGLQGRPKDVEVTAVDGDVLVVAGRRVRLDRLRLPAPAPAAPAGAPDEQEYLVAWTE